MKKRNPNLSAFSLVEIALALGICSFCLLVLLGLLGTGIASSRTSTNETLAINLMNQVVDDLQAAAAGQATSSATLTSPFYGFSIPANGSGMTMATPQTIYVAEDGSMSSVGGIPSSIKDGTAAAFRVTVGFQTLSQSSGVSAGPTAHVLVTWPALADPTATTWPTQYTGSVDTVFTLDRN